MLAAETISNIEAKIGYTFNNKHLLVNSLVHKSYLSEKKRDQDIHENNERLEFLGDAVLELIVTEYLFDKFTASEGYLTSLRASLVNYRLIGLVGQELGLEDCILLSHGEKSELGKARLTIVADCVEAILGAIHIDGGLENAREFVTSYILPKLPEIIENKAFKDPKTKLQEYLQKNMKQTPKYAVILSEGKDHDKTFIVGVYIGKKLLAEGVGRSKQIAETNAATLALEKFSNEEVLNLDSNQTSNQLSDQINQENI